MHCRIMAMVLLCVFLGGAVIPFYLYAVVGGRYFLLVPLVVLFFAQRPARIVAQRSDGPALNAALGLTGRLLLMFSIVFALGWVL